MHQDRCTGDQQPRAHFRRQPCRRIGAEVEPQREQQQPLRGQGVVAEPADQQRRRHEQHGAGEDGRGTPRGPCQQQRGHAALQHAVAHQPQADVLERLRQPRRQRFEQQCQQGQRVRVRDRGADRIPQLGHQAGRPVPRRVAEHRPAAAVLGQVGAEQPADRRRVGQCRAQRAREEDQAAGGADAEGERAVDLLPARRDRAETEQGQHGDEDQRAVRRKTRNRRARCGDAIEQMQRVEQQQGADRGVHRGFDPPGLRRADGRRAAISASEIGRGRAFHRGPGGSIGSRAHCVLQCFAAIDADVRRIVAHECL